MPDLLLFHCSCPNLSVLKTIFKMRKHIKSLLHAKSTIKEYLNMHIRDNYSYNKITEIFGWDFEIKNMLYIYSVN